MARQVQGGRQRTGQILRKPNGDSGVHYAIFGGDDSLKTGSKKSSDSHINILSFPKKDNDTNKIKENLKKFNFNIQPPKFTIHAIDLLKGETILRRKGQPSKSDEMFVERITDLKLDFIGSRN